MSGGQYFPYARACALAERMSEGDRRIVGEDRDVTAARWQADKCWRELRDGFLHDTPEGRDHLQERVDRATAAYAREFVRCAERVLAVGHHPPITPV